MKSVLQGGTRLGAAVLFVFACGTLTGFLSPEAVRLRLEIRLQAAQIQALREAGPRDQEARVAAALERLAVCERELEACEARLGP